MKIRQVFGIFLLLIVPIFFPIISASFTTKSNYESENAGLMDSPWPMFRHDVHHTGRSPYGKGGCTALLKWKINISGIDIPSVVIDKKGVIYTGSHKLYAIHSNGTIKWTLNISVWGVAIARDGTIYVSTWGKNLYAVNPDGTIKWKCNLKDGACGDPLIGENGIIYIGTLDPLLADGKFYAVYPNGTIKWSVKLDGCSSAIIHDDTVYTDCCRDGRLYAIYANNGTIKWKKWIGSTGRLSSGPSVDEEGIVYYGSRNGYLYAFYPNGTLKWKYNIGGTYMPPVISENGTLYIASGNRVYAFDRNGNLLWKRKTYSANELVMDKNGIIYGVGEHHVYALNPNGTLRWVWKTNDHLVNGPVIGGDGTIYVTGYDSKLIGHIYAIEPGDAADLRITGIHLGFDVGGFRIKVKNVGCRPAHNVTCGVVMRTYAWREDEMAIFEFTTTVPEIDVNEEVVVKIKGMSLNPLYYSPAFWDCSFELLYVESEDANPDMLWEGGDFFPVTVFGPFVWVGGFIPWILGVRGWAEV